MYSNKVWISDPFFSYSRLTSSESFDWKFVTWWVWLQSHTCICLGGLKWYLRAVLSPAVKGNWNYCNPGCSCGTYAVCVPILSSFVYTNVPDLYEQGELGLSLLLCYHVAKVDSIITVIGHGFLNLWILNTVLLQHQVANLLFPHPSPVINSWCGISYTCFRFENCDQCLETGYWMVQPWHPARCSWQ